MQKGYQNFAEKGAPNTQLTRLDVQESPPAPQSSNNYLKHLPRINLGFSGKYTEWENFRDLFRSMVHCQAGLFPITTSGKAISIVKQFPIDEKHYTDAWNSLRDYYENSRRLVNAHLTEFFQLNP